MITLIPSEVFVEWLKELRDQRARARIAARLRKAQEGHFGDVKPVGGGVMEMRIDFGPGYRVYYMRRASTHYVLLAGGDKSGQARDIKVALRLAAEWKD